jgi:hypothetical protein
MAKSAGAETLDFMKEDIYERIQESDQWTRRGCLHRRGGHGAAYNREL